MSELSLYTIFNRAALYPVFTQENAYFSPGGVGNHKHWKSPSGCSLGIIVYRHFFSIWWFRALGGHRSAFSPYSSTWDSTIFFHEAGRPWWDFIFNASLQWVKVHGRAPLGVHRLTKHPPWRLSIFGPFLPCHAKPKWPVHVGVMAGRNSSSRHKTSMHQWHSVYQRTVDAWHWSGICLSLRVRTIRQKFWSTSLR